MGIAAAFETVKNQRQPFTPAGPVDVDKVAVGQLHPLALQDGPRAPAEQNRPKRLKVGVSQPPCGGEPAFDDYAARRRLSLRAGVGNGRVGFEVQPFLSPTE